MITKLSFNPRVLAGGRDGYGFLSTRLLLFQSTRPRGRTRLDLICRKLSLLRFNPRVLAGGRDFQHTGG